MKRVPLRLPLQLQHTVLKTIHFVVFKNQQDLSYILPVKGSLCYPVFVGAQRS